MVTLISFLSETLVLLESFFETKELKNDWVALLQKKILLPENSTVGPAPALNDFMKPNPQTPFYLMKGRV